MAVKIYHAACGGFVFNYAERPTKTQEYEAAKVVHQDGGATKNRGAFAFGCPKCGATLGAPSDFVPEGNWWAPG